jgi:hypothetical protein
MAESTYPIEPRYLFRDATSLPWRASAYVQGVVFPTHRHTGPEFIYMPEGEAIQNGQRLGPGWAGVAECGTLDEHFRSETGYVFLIMHSA